MALGQQLNALAIGAANAEAIGSSVQAGKDTARNERAYNAFADKNATPEDPTGAMAASPYGKLDREIQDKHVADAKEHFLGAIDALTAVDQQVPADAPPEQAEQWRATHFDEVAKMLDQAGFGIDKEHMEPLKAQYTKGGAASFAPLLGVLAPERNQTVGAPVGVDKDGNVVMSTKGGGQKTLDGVGAISTVNAGLRAESASALEAQKQEGREKLARIREAAKGGGEMAPDDVQYAAEAFRSSGSMAGLGIKAGSVQAAQVLTAAREQADLAGDTGQSLMLAKAQAAATKKAATELANTTPSSDGGKLRMITSAAAHLAGLQHLADALQNGDVRAINAAQNAYKTQFGESAPNDYRILARIAADEVNRVFVPGVGTGHEREALLKLLGENSSPAQTKQAIATAIEAMRVQGQTIYTKASAYGLGDQVLQIVGPQARKQFQLPEPGQQAAAPQAAPAASAPPAAAAAPVAAPAPAAKPIAGARTPEDARRAFLNSGFKK